MSREKECKCCHEWWYTSVIKEDLCPNCYDYFKQLKRQLEEKDKEIEHLKDAVNMCQSIKRYDIGEMLIENAKLKQNQTQLAIQELEKVKNFVDGRTYCADYINKRIQDLKGE